MPGGWWCCCSEGGDCNIFTDDMSRAVTHTTSWTAPGTVTSTGSGNAWSDPGNATADDGSYATVDVTSVDCNTSQTQWLKCVNFGFSIPTDSVIVAIRVRARAYQAAGTGRLTAVFIDNDGKTSDEYVHAFSIPTTEGTVTFVPSGTPAHKTWFHPKVSPGIVNHANWGVQIYACDATAGGGGTMYIDIVEMQIDYATPALATDWAVQSGTWALETTEDDRYVLATQDANAYIRCETAHPSSEAAHYVYVWVWKSAVGDDTVDYWTHGDKARIVLSDTIYAELEYGFDPYYCNDTSGGGGTIGCSRVRLYEGTTMLVESPLLRVAIYNAYRIAFAAGYRDDTPVVWAAISGAVRFYNPWYESWCVISSDVTSPPTGTKVGVGTGDTVTGTVAFNYFNYEKHNSATVTDCWQPCTEDTPAATCVLSYGIWAREKTSLSSNDLGCDYTIASGTWDAVNTDPYMPGWAGYITTTSSSALIECDMNAGTTNGYMYLTIFIEIENEGDVAVLWLDYDAGTGDGHCVEVTCGNAVDGSNGKVTLLKNGVELEERAFTVKAATFVGITVCTSDPNDGSGFDKFSVSHYYSLSNLCVAATTLNGGEQYAFGTGASNTGYVRVYVGGYYCWGPTWYDNYDECDECQHVDCNHCPADDGPNNGLSFLLSGFGNGHSEPCDCTDLDGTYAVPVTGVYAKCEGSAQWTWCVVAYYLYPQTYYISVSWEITAIVGGWQLDVWILLTLYPSIECPNRGGAKYTATFTMTDLCTGLADVALTFDSYIAPSGGPWCLGSTPMECINWDTLTLEVTSY